MKKTMLFLLTLCSLVFCTMSAAIPVFADCGKIVIYVHRWPRPPRPPRPPQWDNPPTYTPPVDHAWQIPNYGQTNQQQQQQQQTINNASNNSVNVTVNPRNGTGTVPPPPPANAGAIAYGDDTFLEGVQQAVIAWNGKSDDSGEETLILTTNEKSNTGEPMAMLSVLPLPGKPISIERANTKVFVQTKILLDKKITEKQPSNGGVVGYGVIMTQKIGSHNIFVWEMEDINTFEDEVNAYVAQKYDNNAKALITPKTITIIKDYYRRGFRYFAFDLTLVDNTASTKEAIAYRFKSTFAYYPLAISGIGGTGHGLIDLIVMTPGAINLSGAFEKDKEEVPIIVKGNTSVDFTMKEVRDLEPQLADTFKNNSINSVRVRNFLIETDDIGGFKSDFMAIPAQ